MPEPFRRRSVLAAAVALTLMAGAARAQDQAQDQAPVVAAAADLQFAVEEIAARFSEETGMTVRLSLGSTGNFARQIREGAPFEMFMAADEQFILDLHRDGFTRDEGDLYAVGRIVVKVPEGSSLVADGTFGTLREALEAGRITRFAIANPEHAPYGQRAEEALRHAGLWDAIQPYLVLGENVAQAAQFALSGNAEGGIIAYSLALAPNVAAQGSHDLIPEEWHEPLRQRMVLLNGAGPVAEAFYDYIRSPSAREIMERYGFVLPDDG
ncbi:molybdate ABC transporter substrate-binding protein [Rubellimicrobium sp. CFH 75288]|uniref:molybdate ABC transporter substrate-binding protein n=1 Tax=Rubellimicrobium sp. CFH 75288 TaxID=2697034 RepID=UPI001412C9EE|nr:molybdate ABC transporter substrate-binding protein [Rubellimicrobium sp. CFH 75288]NAZ35674.1 molybdate ABC transporter substrate-binding protein [Rubellimicrobium sp. CFH 75288]